MNWVWLFGKKYTMRIVLPYGGTEHMFKSRFQNCPRPGDQIVTAQIFNGRCQWIVESVEHLEGNRTQITVKPVTPL